MQRPDDVRRIAIGIQARSTSKRFPRKIFELVGEKMIIQHIYDACCSSEKYINRLKQICSVHVLVPFNDELCRAYPKQVIEGPENDVLARYIKLQEYTNADYIVRVTADCPLLPEFLISKAITLAYKMGHDYCSNVQENARTSVDGYDVEVFSKKALDWLKVNATTPGQKEHVTLALRSGTLPGNFKVGHMVGHLNLSHIKLSVDTKEDLERVREEYRRTNEVFLNIKQLPGHNQIHRY